MFSRQPVDSLAGRPGRAALLFLQTSKSATGAAGWLHALTLPARRTASLVHWNSAAWPPPRATPTSKHHALGRLEAGQRRHGLAVVVPGVTHPRCGTAEHSILDARATEDSREHRRACIARSQAASNTKAADLPRPALPRPLCPALNRISTPHLSACPSCPPTCTRPAPTGGSSSTGVRSKLEQGDVAGVRRSSRQPKLRAQHQSATCIQLWSN